VEAVVRSPLTRAATLPDGTRFPLPGWALHLGRTPPTERYVLLGRPDFRRPRPPWRYVERMGDYHLLEDDRVRLTVITRERAGRVTEASFVVEPR
jgi:hypothetical protein